MIVPMKKATLIVMKEDKDDVLYALQESGHFMVIGSESTDTEEVKQEDLQEKSDGLTAVIQQNETILRAIKPYNKKSLLSPNPEITYEDFKEVSVEGKEAIETINRTLNTMQAKESRIANLRSENLHLRPWLDLNEPCNANKDTKSTITRTGFIEDAFIPELKELLEEYGGVLTLYGYGEPGHAGMVTYLKDDKEAIDTELKNLGFTDTALPDISELPKDRYAENIRRMKRLSSEIAILNKYINNPNENIEDINLFHEQMVAEHERESVDYVETAETVCFQGWVRFDKTVVIRKVVGKVTDVFELNFEEPSDDETPPTILENHKFWHPFEMITEMYSMPPQGSVDPTPVAGFWYWLIFGMMMGDVGYGALVALFSLVVKKFKKPKGDMLRLLNLLLYASIPTMIFGVLFGSYFGVELTKPILFSPIDSPISMLIFSMIIGALHVISGMCIQIAQNIKDGDVMAAIYDQVSWIVAIIGVGLMFIPSLSQIGKVMAIAGALVVLLFAGRDRKNIIVRLLSGLYSLYDASGYLSDILSYSRILALSLATGVIAYVMNLLAGMAQGAGIIGFVLSIFIYLIGHIFNLAISLLSAYVHDSRLQYIEFFGKFYEGGGIPFTPLKFDPKTYDFVKK